MALDRQKAAACGSHGVRWQLPLGMASFHPHEMSGREREVSEGLPQYCFPIPRKVT